MLTANVTDTLCLEERLDDIQHRCELREDDGLLAFAAILNLFEQLKDLPNLC